MYTFDNCVTFLTTHPPSLHVVFEQRAHGLNECDLARDKLTNDLGTVLIHEGVVTEENIYAAYATFRVGDFQILLSYSNVKPGPKPSAESELRRRASSEAKWKLLAMGDTVARVADPESIDV